MQTFTFFPNTVKLFLIPILFFNIILASEAGINKINSNSSSDSIDQDWYSSIMNNLKMDEFNIIYSEGMKAYQSPNRANNIRFIYHKDGFTAKTRSNKISLLNVNDKSIQDKDSEYENVDEWEITFKLNNVETNLTNSANHTNFNESKLTVLGNKAFIEDENIRIDYTNNKEGMRQDFIVKKRPNNEGKLILNISADTKLNMIIGSDALIFKSEDGNTLMKYSSLKCWDKNGKELRAYFRRNSELGIMNYELKTQSNNSVEGFPKSFSIVVNDEDAIYPITIDPLSTSLDWTAESNQAGAYFGSSVSTAGDVNGDGYSDVIVGSPNFDNGESNEGRAFVYYGSAAGLSTTANWTTESNQVDAEFGTSVATAGDVNGDGYSDVIVGSPYYDNGESNEGRAFVYYGSASGLSTTANWTTESNQVDAEFGTSVATAGDVNGDGYSDVIVGAIGFDNGELNEGRAFVYYGSTSGLSTTANWTTESNKAGAKFGASVSTAGDVNGDGYSDVIVGAALFSNDQGFEGSAYVYNGSALGLSATANWIKEGNQVGAIYGFSVSTAGDVNGDGYSDVIVGAIGFDNGETDEGRAYIYQGSASGLSVIANWTAESNQGSAQLGRSVSTAGDVNGDGFSDVITGARFYNNEETNEGRAFVYHGSAAGLSLTAGLSKEQFGSRYGSSVSSAGDVNGDGYSDVIIGAPAFENGELNEGAAYVHHGSLFGLSTTFNWKVESNQAGAYFGSSVSTAGDVNGDGYSDVIVGSPNFDNGESNEGRAFVYYGSAAGLSTTANWTVESNQAGAYFGSSVSTAGDVNGDGYSDVIVGAPKFDNGETDEGRVFVYHGSASGLLTIPSWIVEGDIENVGFGTSVSIAGDVNGDGYSDVIVGRAERIFDGPDNGMAFVYHGSELGLSTTANWTAESNDVTARFGWSVSTAGDVNGDGYSDVIVGAALFSNDQGFEGSAYVYNGSAMGLSATANWIKEGNQVGAIYGFSVSTAGDVNGDGYSDVIVGAIGFDNGETDEGRAYVYHGSELGLSITEQWFAESDETKAVFGFSVSTIGDVNGDGFSDVIIGEDGLQLGGIPGGDGTNSVNIYYGNLGTGIESTVQQYKPNTSTIIAAGGFSGQNGSVDFGLHSKSPFGRADGRMVYEYKANGMPFSYADGRVTNSVSNSGFGSTFEDLGLTGTELIEQISGLSATNLYKWRVRTEYSLVNNPFQKYGPWKYYSNYAAKLPDGFKPSIALPLNILASLTIYLEGTYNSTNNDMDINLTGNIPLTSPYTEDTKTVTSIPTKVVDWVLVRLRSKINATNILASRSAFLLEDGSIVEINGAGSVRFSLPADNYFISVKHRNHLEVMSNNSISLTTN